jgi:two-component system phosphate regulon sensor histidine kinase PhoR
MAKPRRRDDSIADDIDDLAAHREALLPLTIPLVGLLAYTAFGSIPAGASVVVLSSLLVSLLQRRATRRRLERFTFGKRNQRQQFDLLQSQLQSLQHEARQAMTALSKMRDGVVMLSREKNVLLINPAARRLLNLEPEQDYLGRFFDEFVRLPDLTRAVAATADDGTGQSMTLEIVANDRIRPVKFRIDLVTPSVTGLLLMTLRDETETRRVEEMRREFVANISHELKTPLAAIKGYAETVELAINDDPQAAVHFMSQINTQCRRMERLIADMMQLARAQAGAEHLDFKSVAVADVIADSLRAYRPIAEAKNIELVLGPDLHAIVHADTEATLTIANNLIGNAIHYTPHGGTVTINCRAQGSAWAIVVSDTGVGIAKDEQERIFERFYRVQKNRDAAGGGTGIGLSMVKNLANTMGGQVRVESEPGRGSTFEVLLPRAENG